MSRTKNPAGMTPAEMTEFTRRAKEMASASLLFALRDISETLNAWSECGEPHPNEGWYLDEMAVYGSELNRRRESTLVSRPPYRLR